MKIMFSAGEASGDMHAAAVAEMIKQKHPHIEMLGMGGNAMRRAGVRIVYDIEHLGITTASSVAIAAATFGLISGSMVGGPVAKRLIEIDKKGFDEYVFLH